MVNSEQVDGSRQQVEGNIVGVLLYDGKFFVVTTAVVDVESRKRNKRKIGPPLKI